VSTIVNYILCIIRQTEKSDGNGFLWLQLSEFPFEGAVEDGGQEGVVFLHKPEEQGRADPLVAVHEGMILDQKVKEVGRFFLDAGIDLLAVEGLHDRAERPFQAVVLFQAEEV